MKLRPGRPRNRWVVQIQNDNNLPPADLWRHAVIAERRYGPCWLSDDNNNNNTNVTMCQNRLTQITQ